MIKHQNLTNQIKNYRELSGVDMYSCLVSWHAAAAPCFAFHISSVISCTNFICIVHMHRTCVELSVSTSFLCTLCYWYWSATWNWACPILARFSLDFRHTVRKPGLVEQYLLLCYLAWAIFGQCGVWSRWTVPHLSAVLCWSDAGQRGVQTPAMPILGSAMSTTN